MFLYPAIAAGFALVAVPPLVHLINLLRHRRQQWAAMDFLLASYRRQRKWIRLRQLLLLLSRMAIATLLVAMLAGWTGSGPVASLIGGQTNHHVVILDDSVSMDAGVAGGIGGGLTGGLGGEFGDGQTSAYTRALAAISDLTRRIAADNGVHQLTVIRTSRAALAVSGGGESADAVADIAAGTVTPQQLLIEPLMSTKVSTLAVSPEPAIRLAVELVDRVPADTTRFYIASDYRQTDWGTPDKLADALAKLPAEVEVRLIDCVGGTNTSSNTENLAITRLEPSPDVWVAGVPVVMRMTVRNFGRREATSVSPTIRVIRYDNDLEVVDTNEIRSGVAEDIPAAVITSIPAGGEVTRTFQVFVAQAGTHAVEVSLPADALAADNTRVCTLPLSEAEKVLVIDGSPGGLGALTISSVLDPGSQVRIGAVPEIRPPSFLRDATADTLSTYRAVYLSDVDQIGETAAEALRSYVERGGGLAIFVGQNAEPSIYNASLLPRGLLPGRLEKIAEQKIAEQNNTCQNGPPDATNPSGFAAGNDSTIVGPDIVISNTRSIITDPIRAVGEAALSMVSLNRSWSISDAADNQRGYQTLLRRRDGLPLITTSTVGAGRVLVSLTGLSDGWTNWTGDPTFVVFLLQTNAALYSGAAPAVSRLVTDELTVAPEKTSSGGFAGSSVPPSIGIAAATYFPPIASPPRGGIEVIATADQTTPSVDPATVLIDAGASLPDFLAAGLGEWSYTAADGSGVVVPVASVIDPSDGNLERADSASIVQSLPGVNATMVTAAVWSEEVSRRAGSTLSLVLLGLLAAAFGIEQMLAYWASYHVRSPKTKHPSLPGRAAAGGAG